MSKPQGGGGGGNTLTTVQSHSPPPPFVNALNQQLGTVQNTGAIPYQNYPGQLQAGFSPQQTQGFELVGNVPGMEAPYLNTAAEHLDAATTPLLPGLQPYLNQAGGYFGQAGAADITGALSPYSSQAGSYFGQAANANLPGAVAPTNQGAENLLYSSTGPVGPMAYSQGAINSYFNPYINDVVNATQAQFTQQNQQAANQLRGQAASAGALGGDRAGVAEAVLAGQQQTAQAPVIAGLYSQGFGQAQQEFNTQQATTLQAQQADEARKQAAASGLLGVGQQNLTAAQQQAAIQQAAGQGFAGLGGEAVTAAQQEAATRMAAGQGFGALGGQALGANEANAWLNSQAGMGFAGLGNQAQTSTLQAAQALLGAGGQQQQQAQQGLNIPYQQWIAQQAYPFQTAGWTGGALAQLANAAGGTSSTTSPGPSPFSQIAGLGAGAVGTLGATGAFGDNGYLTNLFNGGGGQDISQQITGGIGAMDPSSILQPSDYATGARGGGVGFSAAGVPRVGFAAGGQPKPPKVPKPFGGFGVDPFGDTSDLDLPPDVSVGFVPSAPVPGISSAGLDSSSTTTTPSSGGGGGGSGDSIFGTLLKGAGTIAAGIYGGPGAAAGASALGSQIHFGPGGRVGFAPGGSITISADKSPTTGFSVPKMQVNGSMGTGAGGGGGSVTDALNAYLTGQQAGAWKPPMGPVAPPAKPAPPPAPVAAVPQMPLPWWMWGNTGGTGGGASEGGGGGGPTGAASNDLGGLGGNVGGGTEVGGGPGGGGTGGGQGAEPGGGSVFGFGGAVLPRRALGGRLHRQDGGFIPDTDPYDWPGLVAQPQVRPSILTNPSSLTNRPVGSTITLPQVPRPSAGFAAFPQGGVGDPAMTGAPAAEFGKADWLPPRPRSLVNQATDFFSRATPWPAGSPGLGAVVGGQAPPASPVTDETEPPGFGRTPSSAGFTPTPPISPVDDPKGALNQSTMYDPALTQGADDPYLSIEQGSEAAGNAVEGAGGSGGAGGAGGAGGGQGFAAEPDKTTLAATDTTRAGRGVGDGFKEPSPASPWLALAEAGFATAAGQSPFALSNIGAGALKGLESYRSDKRAAEALSTHLAESRARIAESARYHADMAEYRSDQNKNRLLQIQNTHEFQQAKAKYMQGGLDERTAHNLATEDYNTGKLQIGQGNLATRQVTEARLGDQFERTLAFKRDQLQKTEEWRTLRAKLIQDGHDIQTVNNVMTNATNAVTRDFSGKTTLATAAAQQLAQRPAAQPSAKGAAGAASVPDAAVKILKEHPDTRAQFERTFGVSADDYLNRP